MASSPPGTASVLRNLRRGTPGFMIGPPSEFLSGEQWCELHFENCRISEENLLLGPGGFKKQIAGFNVERLGNSARSLALGRHAYEQARTYALTRRHDAAAICGLPPLNGFISELLIYMGLFRLTLGYHGGLSLVAPFGAAALALIGALAVACFVKALGATFLGEPRSSAAS